MKHSGHARYYDRLTPEERFRLDVLATARGDVEESELLNRTCQRMTYTMNHGGYTGRWAGLFDITLRIYIPLAHHLAKLQMVDAFRVLVPYSKTLSHNLAFDAYFTGYQSASRHAGEEEQDPAMEQDTKRLEATIEEHGEFVPEMLERLERELATDAFSLWEGFCAFCEESVGVPAESVVAVVLEQVAAQIEDLKDRAERLELEAETVEEIRGGLAESWRVVEERGV